MVIFPPLTLPVADTRPAVLTLPPVTLPLTLSEVSTPTDVILACALLVTVPAVVAAPVSVAVIMLAAKLPLESLSTTVLVLAALLLASVTVRFPVPADVVRPVPDTARLPTPVWV